MKKVMEGFDEFWSVYPRKVDKLHAERMYERALKLATADEIIRGAARYAWERAGEDPHYTKHPGTWLNRGCWNDEPTTGNRRHDKSVLNAFDRLEQALAGGDDHAAGANDILRLPPR